MKTQKLLVIVASVCLIAFFNVSSFAKTEKETQNLDIYALTNALEDAGLEVVKTEWNSLEFIAPNGEAVIIKSNPKRKKVTVTVDGNKVITAGLDLLCVPEATFGLALDILRCVQFIGEDPI